jgi:aminoglycoside phosphotransferase (APT) family kinase protein
MTGPEARGSRMPYRQLPAELRAFVDDTVGHIAQVTDHATGFSPGVATTVTTDAGDRFFVKAVNGQVNAVSQRMHVREAQNLNLLRTASATTAPSLVALREDAAWVTLIIEHVPGTMPVLPWSGVDLRALVTALDGLARIHAPLPLPTVGDQFGEDFSGWRVLAAGNEIPTDLPTDLARHIDNLADIERDWLRAAEGDGLLHGDIRGDNLLIDGGRARLVDWPFACRGDALVDVVCAAAAVAMQGGPSPQEFVRSTEAGRRADPEAVRALVVAEAGYFVNAARLTPPPGLPTLRAFQRAQAEQFYDWLRALL